MFSPSHLLAWIHLLFLNTVDIRWHFDAEVSFLHIMAVRSGLARYLPVFSNPYQIFLAAWHIGTSQLSKKKNPEVILNSPVAVPYFESKIYIFNLYLSCWTESICQVSVNICQHYYKLPHLCNYFREFLVK